MPENKEKQECSRGFSPRVEMRPLSWLKPYEGNPRQNEEAVPALMESIRQFGFLVPIVANADGIILAGHTRQKAAERLGLEEVPVLIAADLDEVKQKAFRLADNKVGELADWDMKALKVEIDELTSLDFDLEPFGFEIEDEAEVTEDEAPEAEEVEHRCKPGEVWLLGDHRLMCGDSTSAEDVARLMGEERADMIFTDPPYNVAIGDKNKSLQGFAKAGRICENIANDKFDSDEECGEKLWLPAFTNMRAFADDACAIYVTMPQGGTHMMMMMMMMAEAGWQVKHELMWVKDSPTFSMGRLDYDYKHEPICYGWNKKHKFFGKGEQTKSVWEFPKPKKCDLHPTMKPMALVGNALKNSSTAGDVVLDLFGGSGTTLVACEQLGRRCRMMELDPKYCDVILARWETLTGRKAERDESAL